MNIISKQDLLKKKSILKLFRPIGSFSVTAFILTIMTVISVVSYNWQAQQDISRNFENLHNYEQLSTQITLLDEIMTNSARMAAITGRERWQAKYNAHAPELDAALARARVYAHTMETYLYMDQVNEANKRLVSLEGAAFKAIEKKELARARKLLNSDEYIRNKNLYVDATRKYDALIKQNIDVEIDSAKYHINMSLTFSILGLLMNVGLWMLLWFNQRDQSKRLEITGHELNLHKTRLEERVKERTKELVEKTRQAEQANIAKSAFLAAMSHEIRTPLNGVLGMAAALDHTALDERQKTMVDVIQQSGDGLRNILDDILDLSKIESGKMTIEKVEFNIKEVFNTIRPLFGTEARKKKLRIDFKISENSKQYNFKGDILRIRQVLTNLMNNAIKFTEKGSISISVELLENPINLSKSPILQFKVEDTGIGIPETKLETIFNTFTQADISTTRKYGGSGLGLTICKNLVELMEGCLNVKSVPGKGSIFSFEIPVMKLALKTEEASKNIEICLIKGLKILAAEDQINNQLVLKALLARSEANLVFADNGVNAIQLWKEEKFDLILMDARMPVMDGLDATREIRKIEQKNDLEKTPIYALTANAQTDHISEYKNAGMDGCIAKPIRPKELYAILNEVSSKIKKEQRIDKNSGKEPAYKKEGSI